MMENVSKENRSEGHPRKRLLTDPNPKGSFVTESPESTVSFDSSSDRFAKKTRELPNLSDCHSCGVRINYTNPRDRLQPLDSLWRIVLLCRKCTKGANSSHLCTYCFSAVVDELDCFKCPNCQHSIHKDCVAQYGSGLGLGFSVCVDCWVPDAFAKSIRARKRKFRKNNESCEQTATLPESRVSVVETDEPDSFVEEMGRKVACATKASENALRKAVVAKNAVELAKGVLSVVASRKVAAGCETKVVDDAELAFLLHRAINSSPRISRYTCLVGSCRRDDAPMICYSRRRAGKKIVLMNSSSLDVPLICYSRRRRKGCLRNSESLNAPLKCYSRRRSGSKACSHDIECECFICKASKETDQHGSTSSAGLKACNLGSNCHENVVGGIDTEPHRSLLKYYRIGKGTPKPSVFIEDSDCSCMNSANLCTKGMPDTRKLGNGNGCHEIFENCDDNTNRFLLKYKRKRSSRYKPKFSCKVEGFSPMLTSNRPVEPTTLSSTRPQST
ncbi:hypothetical protein L1987_15057 [Smallanthus sonchifolius]|uniref:Uncharacterized protein n=1 Tax=Smallanthus sonchifolius TaxID=185202 RepID=A0ACB9J5J0_9ASTR|nr:hypothetical protein L1987_15057 [Smallanthus sonchifolius]